jgi:hypothetical protein
MPVSATADEARALCSEFAKRDRLLFFRIRNSRVALSVVFYDEVDVLMFTEAYPEVGVFQPETFREMDKYMSDNQRDAISILDMAYAFGLMCEKENPDDIALVAMAYELKKTAYAALMLYPCQLFTPADKEVAKKRAEIMVEKGFGKPEIPGVAWTSFLLAEIEKLGKKLKASDNPVNYVRLTAVMEVADIIHGIHVYFDPDYDSDYESIELGIEAAKVYATAI